MAEVWIGADLALALALPVAWLLATLSLSWLALGAGRWVRLGAWWTGSLMVLALLLTLGRLVTIGLLGTLGWWFIADRIILALPLLLPSAMLAGVWTLPAIWQLTHDRPSEDGGMPWAARVMVPPQQPWPGACWARVWRSCNRYRPIRSTASRTQRCLRHGLGGAGTCPGYLLHPVQAPSKSCALLHK